MTVTDSESTRAVASAEPAAPGHHRGKHWIDDWRPEDPEFWSGVGKPVARRNLIYSIFAEHIGFSVWLLWSIVVVQMTAAADGTPRVIWRRAYDRGKARRPGQLTWGSGTTPTYFGPGGDGWVAIVDNAERPRLLVYNSASGGLVCSTTAFGRSGQGTENSPMAWGNSLVIPSTYGYQYPPMAVTGPSVPPDAPFIGGATRIDVGPNGCNRVWENNDRIATLPRLSRADGLIYGLGYGPYRPGPQQLGPVYFIATDFATGRRVATRKVGDAPVDEPLELTGTISRDGAMWQASLGRMLKIAG